MLLQNFAQITNLSATADIKSQSRLTMDVAQFAKKNADLEKMSRLYAQFVKVNVWLMNVEMENVKIVDGICTGVSTHMLCRYRKVHLTNEQGEEQTLLINKSSKFQLGVHYRFYFQKSNHLVIGNDYLDAALSTNNFLGFEIVDGSSATDGLA